jgi:hypothetical protein
MNNALPATGIRVTSNPPTRAKELFGKHQNNIYCQTDRIFAGLMLFQWIAGIALALWISPRTWIGSQSQIHWHVWTAIFIGGIITSFPVMLAIKCPGQVLTRHVIAVGQMLTSALLIHLCGGRIETHFHIFGSLAFLAFYRDRKVLLTATLVVALDHFMRSTLWPESIFGVLHASAWRWVEHAGWVVFEDIFLFISIGQSLRDMWQRAEQQAALEFANQGVEQLVKERTGELEESHRQLLDVSHQFKTIFENSPEGIFKLMRKAVCSPPIRRWPESMVTLHPGN